MRVPPRDADAGWRLWWGLSSVFRAWRPLVGLWGTGGLAAWRHSCIVKQMKHYVKPAVEENPNLYILHVGTNDLRESKSAEKIADEIVDLAVTLKNEKNEVTVSGICPREDNLNDKARNVNENLAWRCHRQKLGFIEHEQLDAKKDTNTSKLHLNKAGNSILQRSFLNEIQM